MMFSCTNPSTDSTLSPDPDYLLPMETVEEDYAFVNLRTGEELPGRFASASMFFEDRALVQDNSTLRYGYIDPSGNYAIDPQYVYATYFVNGTAFVALPDSGLIAINTNGQKLFDLPDVETVSFIRPDLACGTLSNGNSCLIDLKGNITNVGSDKQVIPMFINHSDLILAEQIDNEKFGLIDATGEIVIPFEYDILTPPDKNGIMYYEIDDVGYTQASLLSKDGEKITETYYDAIHICSDRTYCVKTNDKWGVINDKGELIIPIQFDEIIKDGDLYIIQQGDLYGWCDKEGHIVINPQFSEIYPFGKEEITPVRSGREFGYINKKGKFILNPQFSTAGCFSEGLAPVIKSDDDDDLIGYIDQEGKFKINPQFNRASSFIGDLALVIKDDQVGFIDKTGSFTINPQFSDLIFSKDFSINESIGDSYRSKYIYLVGDTPFFGSDQLLPVETKDDKLVLINETGLYSSNLYSDIATDAKRWYSLGYIDNSVLKAQSDKIDIDQIVRQLVSCIKSLDMQATVQQLKAKYGLSNSDFKGIGADLITEDATPCSQLSIQACCNPWNRVSDGWFGYKRVFNENCIPEYYDVCLSLTGKAEYKYDESPFMEKLHQAFNEQMNLTDGTYRLDDKHIELFSEYEGSFIFRVTKQ